MKYLILTLIISLSSFANAKRFMVCIGQEESLIHKHKIGGAHYRLNRELISALLQLRDTIKMKKGAQNEICNSASPSIKTLELILSKKIFYSNYKESQNQNNFKIDRVTIDELEHTASQLFINFITTLQANLPKANCLQKLIPELAVFFEKMQFILEDVGIDRVMQTIKDPSLTFKKLSMINTQKPKC